MKKQLIYLWVIVLTIILFSCNKDDVIQEPAKNGAKQITSFVFKASENTAIAQDVIAVINETNKTINATVANGTVIKSLTPAIVVSNKAITGQSGAKDFSSPVDYTITAEDGTSATYKVTVVIALNSAKQILSFAFKIEDNELYGDETITATIDEANKTITATVSYSANAALLTPSIEISPNASVSPDTAQDFSNPVAYTITAEDGTTITYQILLEITFTDRDALIAIYNANPNNTLDWDLNDTEIGNWQGVPLDSDGNVDKLDLYNKNLDILPPEIGRLSNLTELSLTSNKLTFLPEEIGKLSNLQNLEVDGNQLTTLPASIGQLSNLDNIYLMRNKLISLPPEIGNLTNLITVYINDNNLTSLPKEIVGLTSLTDLDLRDNKFTSFPMELIQHKSLAYLYLSKNLLTLLPKEIGDFTSLVLLSLDENKLTSIPKEIGNLTGLRTLKLTTNFLTTIPAEIGKLTTLTRLYLTENLLTSIPQEVCKLGDTGTTIQLDPGVKCE